MSAPMYSICVPFYKDLNTILRFLASLRVHPPAEPYEVLLSGDCLTGKELSVLRREVFGTDGASVECQRAECHHFSERLPCTVKQNLNICLARGDYIVICDDDIVFLHDEWADRLRRPIEKSSVIAAAGCTTNPTTSVASQKVPIDWNPDEHLHETVDLEEFSGFLWMAKRETFEPDQIGLLQTLGLCYADDFEWSRRARQKYSCRLVACRDVVVEHVRDSSDFRMRRKTAHTYEGRRAKGLCG